MNSIAKRKFKIKKKKKENTPRLELMNEILFYNNF